MNWSDRRFSLRNRPWACSYRLEPSEHCGASWPPARTSESRHPAIVRLAREVTAGRDGWAKVEAIYDTVRERVEYRNGDLKGAARALADGWGDCEELTCLFIAMARASGVPARNGLG